MKLFFHQFGQGPALIILHGLFGISDNWVTLARKLAETHTVYIPDQRNHGRSPHSPTFNYYTLCDDIRELIAREHIHKPVIMGHSMGGKVAMTLALESPEIIDKLIVVDMSLRAYPAKQVHLQIIQAMRQVDFTQVNSRKEIEELMERQISSKKLRLFVMKNLTRINRDTFAWRINLEGIYNNIDSVFEGISVPGTYSQPSLFIRGELSDYVPEADFDLIRSRFPQAQIETIQGASHWVHSDEPAPLCKLLTTFLGRTCDFNKRV